MTIYRNEAKVWSAQTLTTVNDLLFLFRKRPCALTEIHARFRRF